MKLKRYAMTILALLAVSVAYADPMGSPQGTGAAANASGQNQNVVVDDGGTLKMVPKSSVQQNQGQYVPPGAPGGSVNGMPPHNMPSPPMHAMPGQPMVPGQGQMMPGQGQMPGQPMSPPSQGQTSPGMMQGGPMPGAPTQAHPGMMGPNGQSPQAQ